MRTMRRFYWHTIRRWRGEICQDCGRKYFRTIWKAADVDWLNVVGSNEQTSTHLLCPGCFGDRAQSLGRSIIWRPNVV